MCLLTRCHPGCTAPEKKRAQAARTRVSRRVLQAWRAKQRARGSMQPVRAPAGSPAQTCLGRAPSGARRSDFCFGRAGRWRRSAPSRTNYWARHFWMCLRQTQRWERNVTGKHQTTTSTHTQAAGNEFRARPGWQGRGRRPTACGAAARRQAHGHAPLDVWTMPRRVQPPAAMSQ